MAISTPTTPGQILTSAYVNNNINSGLVYVTSKAVGTGVSSETVTGAFSSTYDNYHIVYSGGLCSATGNWFTLQLDATHSTAYFGGATEYTSTGATIDQATSNLGRLLVSRTFNTVGGGSVSFDIFSPNLATAKSVFGTCNGGGSYVIQGGQINYSTAFTSFVLGVSGGTMTGGTISVYGYRKP